jgi:ADP-L-glycero-D-manno-heptose 6-epimerase
MASVVFHAFNQIKNTGKVKLFRSHDPRFKDGEQLRDFIYVYDILKIMYWFMNETGDDKIRPGAVKDPTPGIYNAGTGKARTFKDLVAAIFKSMDLEPSIEFIDTPDDIRDKYQYFTEATMNKLIEAGYSKSFFSLENGIDDYVKNFLLPHKYY